MIPTNFELIRMAEAKGGVRSEKSSKEKDVDAMKENASGDLAVDSVNSKGLPSQWTDLSGPQVKTEESSTEEDERKAQELLANFGRMNMVRALLLGAGGVIGLMTALA